MLKALGRTGDGKPVLILGLSGENVARLMANEPILVDVTKSFGGPPMMVVIVGGRTEDDIKDQLVRNGLLPEAAR